MTPHLVETTQDKIVEVVSQHMTSLAKKQIASTLTLLEEGSTVPFIARYRKEMTGNLDEVQIRDIQQVAKKVSELSQRQNAVSKLIADQGQLTKQLNSAILNATSLQDIEDIYLPYKQKRRTKAMIARENGLQPLVDWLLTHLSATRSQINAQVNDYISEALPTSESIYDGVHEILSEQIGQQALFRQWLRTRLARDGVVSTTLKRGAAEKDEQQIYQQYYDFSETVPRLKQNGYRILAIDRGEKTGILSVKVTFSDERAFFFMKTQLIKSVTGYAADLVIAAIEDAYKRFILPAVTREIRQELTQLAQEEAIKVFGDNLYHLLMQRPLKNKIVMGFDPGYRTGSKLAIIDENGKFLCSQVIYPHKPANKQQRQEAVTLFQQLITQYGVQLVAIGNGTASRESEEFVAMHKPDHVQYAIVNEAGASVYSASKEAREEFPNLHVEERSAISIGRRIQDPLAELIKIDPKSVGVGQYQHDLNVKALDEQVDVVIETAVNQIGVNLNTASPQLLTHIAGLNKTLAQNIVNYRNTQGTFDSRAQLKLVPRLGAKSYEQSAGFLRIVDGKNQLDNTDIHPESYHIAQQLLERVKGQTTDSALTALDNEMMAKTLNVGRETLRDIITSLRRPGRDGRSEMTGALLRADVLHIEDLKVGMKMQGTVRNVVDFGAFVDLGVKQDGLVHISKLAQKRVTHPSEVVAVGDIVDVWIESVDEKRHRIGLSMIGINSLSE